MERISVLGIGRAGGAIAVALRRAGVVVGPLIYRGSPPSLEGFTEADFTAFADLNSIDADVLLIATADQDIRTTALSLGTFHRLPSTILHFSGSLSSGELDSLREKDIAIGSMHPLVSISDPVLGAERFSGAFFCVEGDEAAVGTAMKIVDRLGGNYFSIDPSLKPLYHASAVMASGNVTALFDSAVEMLSKCGIDGYQAHRILLPLLESTVCNLSKRSTKEALTGPFVRGDIDALGRHLAAFEGKIGDDIRSIYLALAERSVRLSGVDGDPQLLNAISVAKQKTGC